jgi:ABC-2 type transport system ATP-binding protein
MIRIEGLVKKFGETVAVAGLDLEVPEGQLFCLLGPNGAGKTTTLKALTGLLKPTAGRTLISGLDMATHPAEAKRLLGYVPDQPFLYERLTGRELMRLVAGLYSLPEAGLADRIADWLERFDLTGVADRLVEEMSHGMRQRLSFAATFLHEPRVLVVDEPWVGLDPRSIRDIKDFLKERTHDGLTVLMSTHSLAIAEEAAEGNGIMHRGRLVASGSVAEIKALASRPGSLEDVFLELTAEGGF